MVASIGALDRLQRSRQRVKQLRALAEDCRNVARIIQYRPDQERMLELAQQHDAEADQLEAAVLRV